MSTGVPHTHTVVLSQSYIPTVAIDDQENSINTLVLTPEKGKACQKRPREEEAVVGTPPPVKEKVYARFKSSVGLGSPVARSLFDQIKQEQQSIRGAKHVAFNHPPTPLFPGFIVTSEDFHVLLKRAGQGGQASASFSESFPLSVNRSPERTLVKVARTPFTPQKQLVSCLDNHAGIDVPGRSGVLINPLSRGQDRFAIFRRSDGDLNHIDYSVVDFETTYGAPPVPFICGQLVSIAAGLETLHANGLIHRDIKGPNALFNIGGIGKLTDTDLLMEEAQEGKTHRVGTTPEYAASYIWTDVTKQKVEENHRITSVGHQSKASDKFASGFMLQTDVVARIIRGLSRKHRIDNPLDLSPVKVVEKQYGTLFTDEEMLEIDREHPGRVVYRFPNQAAKLPGYLSKFPTREDARAKTLAAIDRLVAHLPPKELEGLTQLAELSYTLQDPDPRKMMSTADFVLALKAINEQFHQD
jgi:serine/threonine protein kinase